MGPFFPLFLERNRDTILASGVNLNPNGDDSEDLITCLLQSTPQYNSFADFKKQASQYE